MTVDDLIRLMEAFVGHLTVKDLRQGGDTNSVTELEDEEYATLVKFLAGERPVTEFHRNEVTLVGERFPALDAIGPIHIDATADAQGAMTVEENGKVRRMTAAERWQAANPNSFRPQREDPDHPLTLKGEFDGVQLP